MTSQLTSLVAQTVLVISQELVLLLSGVGDQFEVQEEGLLRVRSDDLPGVVDRWVVPEIKRANMTTKYHPLL